MSLHNTKGQVSIFILTGLIFMVVVGLSVYLFSQNTVKDDSVVLQTQEADREARPIQQFMTSCLEQTSTEALKAIALNGGYVYPLNYFDANIEPTKSEFIIRGPNTMPYWYYYDDATGTFSSNAPALNKQSGLNSIEEQIELYVKQQMPTCLNHFSEFKDRFYVKIEEIDATATITESGLTVQADIPTTIKSRMTENTHSLDTFYVQIPTQFQKIYNLAKDISKTQSQVGFLERPIVELIATKSGVGRPLPPMYEVELFTPGAGSTWLRNQVYDYLRKEILPKISLIQILFTRSFNIPESSVMNTPTIREVASQGILEPSDEYYDLDVDFSYPEQLSPDILVGDGSPVLKADSGESDAAGLFSTLLGAVIRRYRFNYQLSYPVVSRICDQTSFNGEGLCFYFAMEGNIRNNQAFLSITPVNSFFGSASGNSPIVKFDDPGQYLDKIIEFEVRNASDRAPLVGATIHYDCGDETLVGKTVLSGDKAVFSGKMPFCGAGGRIIIRKPGYHSVVRQWNNREGENHVQLAPFELSKVQTLPFTVLKKGEFAFDGTELDGSDQVMISIKKRKEDSREDDFPYLSTFVVGNTTRGGGQEFASNMFALLQESKDSLSSNITGYSAEKLIEGQLSLEDLNQASTLDTIGLVPGDYDITVTYIVSGNPAIHIPAEHKKICAGGEKDADDFCLITLDKYTLPELNMQSWFVSEITYTTTITEDLYDAERLVFYAADLALPQNYDQLEDYGTDVVNTDRYEAKLE